MMATEIWKSIPNYPGYEVSNHGRVRSYKKCVGAGNWVVADTPQRILNPIIRPDGYKMVGLLRSGRPHFRKVARLVLQVFIGPCPDGMEVCHNDNNRANDHLGNLRYDTHAGNMRDWHNKHPFSESDIISIRNRHADGITLQVLADEYSVSKMTMSRICRGMAYAYWGGPLTSGQRRDIIATPTPPPAPQGAEDDAAERKGE